MGTKAPKIPTSSLCLSSISRVVSFGLFFFQIFRFRTMEFALSCAVLLWTNVSSFGNLVTKSATTQKGLQTCFPFEYLLPNLYKYLFVTCYAQLQIIITLYKYLFVTCYVQLQIIITLLHIKFMSVVSLNQI